jgi:hypothetical protein
MDQAQDIGVGQQDPETPNSESQVMEFYVRQILAQYSTVKLVQVKAVHPGSGSPPVAGTVDVQPLVNQLDGAGNSTPHGTIFGLPCLRTSGGTGAIVIDPGVGDIGVALVCDRDSSAAVRSAGVANPGSHRMFDLADGIYLGSLLAANSPSFYLWFDTNGHFQLRDKDGNAVVSSGSGLTATDKNGNIISMAAAGLTLTDVNANIIQMRPGFVNIVTDVFQVNGVPVTVP